MSNEAQVADTEIRPFTLDVPQQQLDDLKRRLEATRRPAGLPGQGWERGVPTSYLDGLLEYWRDGFDWRAQEAKLNELDHFTTTIDGANVHFIHVRSPEENAIPLLLSHGWPGSVVEFLDTIGPLSNPAAHGAEGSQAFHLVIPSIPGFGLSGPTGEEGWGSKRVAAAFATLMERLGYDSYGVQGGDFGAIICPLIGQQNPDKVIGVHVNAPTAGFVPFWEISDEERASLTDLERERLDRMAHFMQEQFGYNSLQSTRPNTLAHALADSPSGQLAWIIEKFFEWTDSTEEQLPEDVIDRDHLLTNAMLYWLTNTGGSSAQFYYEDQHSGEWGGQEKSTVPTGVAVFAQDIAIRRYAEQSNEIVHWSDFDRGGHFAALEAPDLLVGDVSKFFAGLR